MLNYHHRMKKTNIKEVSLLHKAFCLFSSKELPQQTLGYSYFLQFILKKDEDWEDADNVHIPVEWLDFDVDGLTFMDDWGSQKSLLINPKMWEEYFRPMYQDYISIAKKYGKKTFMHSDGNTLDIYPRMIELGLDAFNTQIFCIGVENLEQFKGKITFWGEIDRQHLLPEGTTEDIKKAVEDVHRRLWADGGCIAQCEFGPGANPDNVYTVFET